MAASIGAGASRNNVDLNIVPMIDLMSCLTAFLLVTAAWVNTAKLDTATKTGVGASEHETPRAGLLVQDDRVWLTVSGIGEIVEIADLAGEHDWPTVKNALADSLRRLEALGITKSATEILVAAESTDARPVSYQELITAVDLATNAGFGQIEVTEPAGLALRPGG